MRVPGQVQAASGHLREPVAQGAQARMKVLFAVKVGDPDWKEQLITEVESRIDGAKTWAEANGFDRCRVATIDESPPDFTKTVKRIR
jgi:hypothetical protein